MMPTKTAFAAAALVAAGALAGCSRPADVASNNLSVAADNFQIERQINFIDTITGQNIVTVRGLCSLGNTDKERELSVTCKVGKDANGQDQYVKDFFGLSNSVTYSVVQIGTAAVDSAHYSVEWNPGTLVPHFRGAGGDPLTQSSTFNSTTPGQTAPAHKPSPATITTISP